MSKTVFKATMARQALKRLVSAPAALTPIGTTARAVPATTTHSALRPSVPRGIAR